MGGLVRQVMSNMVLVISVYFPNFLEYTQFYHQKYIFKNCDLEALPWWLSSKESACQCRRHRFNPWSGKIPRAGEQLSPSTTTTEPVLRAWGRKLLTPSCPTASALQQEKPLQSEVRAPQLERSPLSLQQEKSPHSKEDPAQPQINK